MHPYNRLPSSGHSTPSPPQSPRRSPRLRHSRSKTARFSPAQPAGRSVAQRLAWIFLSVLLRRQGFFLFAPLIYISIMLLYMGTVSFDVVPIIKHRPAPGSVYHSPELYAKLRHEMDADNSSADAVGLSRFALLLFLFEMALNYDLESEFCLNCFFYQAVCFLFFLDLLGTMKNDGLSCYSIDLMIGILLYVLNWLHFFGKFLG